MLHTCIIHMSTTSINYAMCSDFNFVKSTLLGLIQQTLFTVKDASTYVYTYTYIRTYRVSYRGGCPGISPAQIESPQNIM